MYQTYKNKRVIWESKNKWIKHTVFAFLFVVVAIFLKAALPPILFWVTVVFFGGMGVFALFWLLNPKNLFVTPDSKLGLEILDYQLRQTHEDLGVFTYSDGGFYYNKNNEESFYKWSDIETVFAHEEEISYDQMCLDIFMNNSVVLELTEETPGWYQFKNRLSEHVPLKAFVWDNEEPEYDPYLTLLFDKKGRTQEEAEAACYPE